MPSSLRTRPLRGHDTQKLEAAGFGHRCDPKYPAARDSPGYDCEWHAFLGMVGDHTP